MTDCVTSVKRRVVSSLLSLLSLVAVSGCGVATGSAIPDEQESSDVRTVEAVTSKPESTGTNGPLTEEAAAARQATEEAEQAVVETQAAEEAKAQADEEGGDYGEFPEQALDEDPNAWYPWLTCDDLAESAFSSSLNRLVGTRRLEVVEDNRKVLELPIEFDEYHLVLACEGTGIWQQQQGTSKSPVRLEYTIDLDADTYIKVLAYHEVLNNG